MQPERIQRLARDERLARHVGFSLRAGVLASVFSIAGSAIAIVVIYLLAAIHGLDYVSFLASFRLE